jgi:hypothetical protein
MTPSWRIVERLAAFEPLRRRRVEPGMYVYECVFCSAQAKHEPDCLWQNARDAMAAYWELEKHT